MIEFFNRIKIVNKDLQMSELCVIDSYRKVEAVMFSLEAFRDSKFEVIWHKVLHGISLGYQRSGAVTTLNFVEIKFHQ